MTRWSKVRWMRVKVTDGSEKAFRSLDGTDEAECVFGIQMWVALLFRPRCRSVPPGCNISSISSKLLTVSFCYLGGAVLLLRATNGEIRFLILMNGIQFLFRIAIGLFVVKEIVVAATPAAKRKETWSWKYFLLPFLPSSVF